MYSLQLPKCFRQFWNKMKLEKKKSQFLLFYIFFLLKLVLRKRKNSIFSFNFVLNEMWFDFFNYFQWKESEIYWKLKTLQTKVTKVRVITDHKQSALYAVGHSKMFRFFIHLFDFHLIEQIFHLIQSIILESYASVKTSVTRKEPAAVTIL